jgi:hypothetical protein
MVEARLSLVAEVLEGRIETDLTSSLPLHLVLG